MDSAEIARLREGGLGVMSNADLQSLLDALEQAQKERDEAIELSQNWEADCRSAEAERDQAQKDVKDARALLVALAESSWTQRAIRDRIEAMLEQKP
jgi:multidrug resistance efflux pump